MSEEKYKFDWLFHRGSDKKAIIRQLGEGISTRIFVGKDSMLSFVQLKPHTQGTIHKHSEEQWGVLLKGKCMRHHDGIEVEVEEGDFWYIPPNIEHGVWTLEQSAEILDIFSPPREAYRKEGEGFGTE